MAELEGAFPERAVPLALEALEHYPYTWQAERALSRAVFEDILAAVPDTYGGGLYDPSGLKLLERNPTSGRLVERFQHGPRHGRPAQPSR